MTKTLDQLLRSDVWDTRDLVELIDGYDEETADEDETEEHARALELAEQLEDSPDYPYGEMVISANYFTQYAIELAEDIGAVSSDAAWPLSYIDWEAAADALKVDYLSVDFEGTEWFIRA